MATAEGGGPARESPSGGEDPDPDPDLAAAAGKRCCVRGDQVAMVRGSLSAVVRCPPAVRAGWTTMAASEEAHEAGEGGLDLSLALSLAWPGRAGLTAQCSVLAASLSLSLEGLFRSFALSASCVSFPAAFSTSLSLSTREKRVSLRRRTLALHYTDCKYRILRTKETLKNI